MIAHSLGKSNVSFSSALLQKSLRNDKIRENQATPAPVGAESPHERKIAMKTRLTALLMALALCFTMLSACGSSNTAPAEEPAAAASSSAEESAPAPAEESAAASTDVAELSAPAEKAVAPEVDPNADPVRVGMLTILNMSEEDAAQLMRARKIAAVQLVKEGALAKNVELATDGITAPYTVTYYDNLESMLMALNAGELDTISVSETVADYLTLTNEGLTKVYDCNEQTEHTEFAKVMEGGILGESYSFMMMEDHADLRDEFDQALTSMKEDGTLDRLIKEQITDVMNGKDPVEIELPPLPDAPTIEVAVTGALPPMDYVGPVGMPVGFSTAVLAEISTRINKNISVSVIDSGARAAALASGKADVVFWTRTSPEAEKAAAATEEEQTAFSEKLTGEELTAIQQMDSIFDIATIANMDMPEGTIVTQPYVSGLNLPVIHQ